MILAANVCGMIPRTRTTVARRVTVIREKKSGPSPAVALSGVLSTKITHSLPGDSVLLMVLRNCVVILIYTNL